MYRNINDGQFSIYDFILPFGGHLKEDNRWVQLHNIIDLKIIDSDKDGKGKGSNSSGNRDDAGPSKEPPNRESLIIYASRTPADIVYPTDLELCDKVRRWTEVILDRYWKFFGSMDGKA